MFDFSFSELAVIGAVALVVLGPERLPGAARTAGQWVGKAKRLMSQMQQELNSQLNTDELNAHINEQRDALNQTLQQTRHEVEQLQRQLPTYRTITSSAQPSPSGDSPASEASEAFHAAPASTPFVPPRRPTIANAALKPSSSTPQE